MSDSWDPGRMRPPRDPKHARHRPQKRVMQLGLGAQAIGAKAPGIGSKARYIPMVAHLSYAGVWRPDAFRICFSG